MVTALHARESPADPRQIRTVAGGASPAPADQSNADQQMSFR